MKRKILALSILTILLISSISFADSYGKKILAYFYDVKVSLDGKPVAFSNEPFIYEGTTYVSLRDAAEVLGISMYWDDRNKSIYMNSDSSNYNKDYEIASLKNQLKDKDKEIERLKNDEDDDDDNDYDDDDLDDLGDDLEDDYYKYSEGYTTLKFEYTISQLSNDDIRIKMYGDFYRNSSAWSRRDDSEFEDFIEDICDRVREDFKEDIEIIVYDEDKDRTAEYSYDYSDRELKNEYEY